MFDRLRLVIAAMTLAFGLLAGAGSAFAWQSQTLPPCHMPTMMHASTDQPAAMPDCGKGMAHKSCALHASFFAFLAPAPSAVWVDTHMPGWLATPVSSLTGTRLPPDTPPPIILL